MQIECMELINISNMIFGTTRYRNGVRGRVFHVSTSYQVLPEKDVAILKVTCSTPDKMWWVHWV